MLTMITPFTTGATGLMAISLLMSGLAMLIVILASLFYVVSINSAGTSLAIETFLAVFAFVVSKLWMTSLLQMVALYNGIGGLRAGTLAVTELSGNKADGVARLVVTLIGALIGA